jgi:hypothetical protein
MRGINTDFDSVFIHILEMDSFLLAAGFSIFLRFDSCFFCQSASGASGNPTQKGAVHDFAFKLVES